MKTKLRTILSHPLTMLAIVGICLTFLFTGHIWFTVFFGLVISALAFYAWGWKEMENEINKISPDEDYWREYNIERDFDPAFRIYPNNVWHHRDYEED